MTLGFAAPVLHAQWAPDGVRVPGLNGWQRVAIPDGVGGAVIVSLGGSSNPNSGWDIQAQRLTRDGRIATGWPSASVFLCTAEGTQSSPLAVPDGTGGALAAWLDDRDTLSTDIHAHHVQGDGALAPGWPVDGLLVVPCSAADGVAVSAALSDRSVQTISLGVAGELLVTWMDQRNGNLDAYAQRLRPDGSIAPGWTIGGSPVVTQVASQFYPLIVSDVASGALVVWSDLRNGNFDVYGQHLRADGTRDPAWPSDGLYVCWQDNRDYATHLSDV